MRINSPVIVTIPGSDLEPIEAKITSIFPETNSQTRTVIVEAIVNNPDGQLLAGQFLEMKIITARKPNAITIPQRAIVQFQDQHSVWIVDGDIVRVQTVTLGKKTEDRIEITSGLKSGEMVVISGQHRLVENASVAVINQESQPIGSNQSFSQEMEIEIVSPDLANGVIMGDVQLVIDINNEQITLEDVEISAIMPMKNMAPMTAKVEVKADSQPGRFLADTYLNMKGTWEIIIQVKNSQHQGKQKFIIEVK